MKFELGKYYRFSTKEHGERLHIVGKVNTTLYGECFVGESTKGSDLSPIGMSADNAQNWSETTVEDFMSFYGS